MNDLTLLYAEDEIETRKNYANYLRRLFKEVYVVANGQEALNVYLEKKPKLQPDPSLNAVYSLFFFEACPSTLYMLLAIFVRLSTNSKQFFSVSSKHLTPEGYFLFKSSSI